ncbi:hypothetical protein ACFLR0_01945 [Candidatus Bipolaricaulota bacterium]
MARSSMFSLRLTDEEKDLLRRLGEMANRSQASVIRMLLASAASLVDSWPEGRLFPMQNPLDIEATMKEFRSRLAHAEPSAEVMKQLGELQESWATSLESISTQMQLVQSRFRSWQAEISGLSASREAPAAAGRAEERK